MVANGGGGRYLDKLKRMLMKSAKTFREIIVVHNLKDVSNEKAHTQFPPKPLPHNNYSSKLLTNLSKTMSQLPLIRELGLSYVCVWGGGI